MVLEIQSFPLLLLSPGPGNRLLMRMENKFTKAGGREGLEGDQDPALGSLGLLEMCLFAWDWCSQGDTGDATRPHSHHLSSLGWQEPIRASSVSPAVQAEPAATVGHTEHPLPGPHQLRVPSTASAQLG